MTNATRNKIIERILNVTFSRREWDDSARGEARVALRFQQPTPRIFHRCPEAEAAYAAAQELEHHVEEWLQGHGYLTQREILLLAGQAIRDWKRL